MPFKPREPALFPEWLLDAPPPADGARRWLVIHTRPRQEKALGRVLLSRQIPFYLPLVRRRHRLARRMLVSDVPLFSGYVFTYSSDQERLHIVRTNRVVDVLAVPDEGQLIRELRQVYCVLASQASIEPEGDVGVGSRVRVVRGPFQGLEGMVVKRRQGFRLIVAVTMLGQGVSLDIDDSLLEAAD